MFLLKPLIALLGAVGAVLLAVAAQPGASFVEYGLSGAIVLVVAMFLAFLRHALGTLKMLADNCHNAHQEDLKRIESITDNLNRSMDKAIRGVGG